MDLIQTQDACDGTLWALNIVDAASGFQVVVYITRRTSECVIEVYERCWASWAGHPVTVVVDVGPEFTSTEFCEHLEASGVMPHHIPVEAPWQNGIAERHGGAFKVTLAAVVAEHAPVGLADMQTAANVVTQSKNDEINETGFSASQWILGKQRRIPGDVLNASVVQRLGEHGALEVPRFAKRIAMMETAKRALVRLRFSRRLAHAEMARARVTPESTNYLIGDMVYFFRKSAVLPKAEDPRKRGKRRIVFNRWHGPAVVLAVEGKSGLYLGYRGCVTKCAPEAVRLASSLEQLSAEAWADALSDVLEQCNRVVPVQQPVNPTGVEMPEPNVDSDGQVEDPLTGILSLFPSTSLPSVPEDAPLPGDGSTPLNNENWRRRNNSGWSSTQRSGSDSQSPDVEAGVPTSGEQDHPTNLPVEPVLSATPLPVAGVSPSESPAATMELDSRPSLAPSFETTLPERLESLRTCMKRRRDREDAEEPTVVERPSQAARIQRSTSEPVLGHASGDRKPVSEMEALMGMATPSPPVCTTKPTISAIVVAPLPTYIDHTIITSHGESRNATNARDASNTNWCESSIRPDKPTCISECMSIHVPNTGFCKNSTTEIGVHKVMATQAVADANVSATFPLTYSEHPLTQLFTELANENCACVGGTSPGAGDVRDHGTFMASWSLPGRDEFYRMCDGRPEGTGMSKFRYSKNFEVNATQKGGRKELVWNRMSGQERGAFSDALQKHWNNWTINEAVEVKQIEESLKIEKRLGDAGHSKDILQMRTVLTDKNDGLRTPTNPLPQEPSARIIVDGYKDTALLEGKLRTDAPTGSRNAQFLLCLYAGCHPNWAFSCADV